MLVTKHLKERDFELKYKYYEYSIPQTVSIEYARYKLVKKLNLHLIKALNLTKPLTMSITSIIVSNLLLNGISENMNKKDPVLIEITGKHINKIYEKVVAPDIVDALNNKVNKYIEQLATIPDTRKLVKEVEGDNFVFKILDRENTKIKINKNIYQKILSRYAQHNNERQDLEFIDQLIWSALFRYKYLGILDGKQGAVNTNELEYLRNNFGANVELFGSIINTTLKYYCSLFYDLEKYFGSLGNFFNTELFRGFYELNPPFIIWIMEDSFAHIRKMLDAHKGITVFITIPVWDIYDRKILNKHCGTEKKTDYTNLKLDVLKRTKYIVFDRLYCQDAYSYTDYVAAKKNVHFSQTNVLLVSNEYKKNEISLPFLSGDYVNSDDNKDNDNF